MKGLTLNTKEQTRLQVFNGVLERRWSMRETAEVLGVSERQVWRLLAAYRKEGVAALAHGNRGGVPFGGTSFAAPDSNSKLTPKTPEASSKSKLYNFGLKDAHEHRVE